MTAPSPLAPSAATANNSFETSLNEHLKAGYQIMYIPTSEETRVQAEIEKIAIASDTYASVVTWDSAVGFTGCKLLEDTKFRNPMLALDAIVDMTILPSGKKRKSDDGESERERHARLVSGNYVFVFRDLDDYMADPQVRRRIKSLGEGNRLVNSDFRRPLLIVSPLLNIHPKLKTVVTILDFSLPDDVYLSRHFAAVRSQIASDYSPDLATCSDELQLAVTKNLRGLTMNEADNCLSRCIVRHGGVTPNMLQTIKAEKAAIVRKSEVLTYIPEEAAWQREDIGGFDLYMNWLDKRKLAYTPAAAAVKLDYPRGVVLVGVPGTGKSLVAKATCAMLGLPGYILDVGALFGSLVGESEQRIRDTLKQIDAQQGCVLVIDEADKALGNAANASGDSGVTKRLFGTLLTWLAENKSGTFCIMTLNRTTGMPPELLRAGRFDAVFYTDLPTEAERRQIMEIHLRRRNVDTATLSLQPEDWDALCEKSKGYVGSELEEAVREARYTAFANRGSGNPTFQELHEALAAIVPMTARDPEGIKEIREFCKDRALPVTSTVTTKKAVGNRTPRQRAIELPPTNQN